MCTSCGREYRSACVFSRVAGVVLISCRSVRLDGVTYCSLSWLLSTATPTFVQPLFFFVWLRPNTWRKLADSLISQPTSRFLRIPLHHTTPPRETSDSFLPTLPAHGSPRRTSFLTNSCAGRTQHHCSVRQVHLRTSESPGKPARRPCRVSFCSCTPSRPSSRRRPLRTPSYSTARSAHLVPRWARPQSTGCSDERAAPGTRRQMPSMISSVNVRPVPAACVLLPCLFSPGGPCVPHRFAHRDPAEA